MIFKNEKKRQLAVGMAKRFFDEGKTTKEVAELMCLSESTVRSLKSTIDKAKENGYKN
jgi:DNA-binding NarL/FixJ family response regulator